MKQGGIVSYSRIFEHSQSYSKVFKCRCFPNPKKLGLLLYKL